MSFSSLACNFAVVYDAMVVCGCRLSLVEAWRGLRDEELCSASGIEGSTFVHTAGFIGGNKTLDGALAMARITLKTAASS